MAIPVFPQIIPEVITSIEPPKYASAFAEFSNGDKRFKQTQFQGSGTLIQATFNYLPSNQLNQIIALWDLTKGHKSFTFPPSFFAHMPPNILSMLSSWSGTSRWIMSEAPSPKPIIWCGKSVANVCDLDITFISVIT